jgi:PIN domain nuclease of toxin-antitoxin system
LIYFDTHALTALDRQDLRRFSKDAQRLFDNDTDLRVSPMVLLEIDFLHEIRRLRLSSAEYMRVLEERFSIRVCDRPFADVALAAAAERWTRDPFDRIIVAQARIAKAHLITRDTTIQSHYGRAVG